MQGRLNKGQRQEIIVALLRSNAAVRISSLAGDFGVSTETIRRDIDALSEQGLVSRTYGGAASVSLTAEPGISQREQQSVAERRRIARHAVSLVEAGDVLMIDSGSTTTHFAHALAARPMELTVLTNCLPVANALVKVPEFRIMLCPGLYIAHELGVYGQETIEFLKRFNANKTIIGASGLTVEGATDVDSRASWVKRTMIERAERSILLADSGKFDVHQFEVVCPLSDIDDIVSDAAPGAPIARAITDARATLHIAPPAETGT